MRDFKSICDNLPAIKSPVLDPDKVFQFAQRNFQNGGNLRKQYTSTTFPEEEQHQQQKLFGHQIDNIKVSCQICGKFNHSAIDSWYRFDHSYQSEDLPHAHAALTLNNSKDQSFIVDSGATSHMINYAGNLSYVKPYHGNDVIYVGNGNSIP